jgi:hypothetical protein
MRFPIFNSANITDLIVEMWKFLSTEYSFRDNYNYFVCLPFCPLSGWSHVLWGNDTNNFCTSRFLL